MTDDTDPRVDESRAETETTNEDRNTIRTGRNFEEEFHLESDEAGRFLIDLGEQLQAGDELTIETDEWSLPFGFEEPVDVEIDFEGVGDPELEIEVELRGSREDAPTVD